VSKLDPNSNWRLGFATIGNEDTVPKERIGERRGKAEDGLGDPASTVPNAIRPVPSMTTEAKLVSIHCGRLMVRASLPALVATHI
jgi:hypothetical protein